MRIALDATYSVDPHPSGIAIYSRELLNGLAVRNAKDEFVHCYRLKQFRQAPASRHTNVRNRLLLPPLPTFSADLFHALNQRVDRRPARKVVSTFHDLFVMTANYSGEEFRKRFTEQAMRAAKNSDLMIAVSEFTASQIEGLLHIERSRIRVIPHGVRAPQVSARANREPMILFVGALQTRKNVARLVDAMDAVPPEWRLVLVGATTGYQADSILERIKDSSNRNRIEVAGYLSPNHLERLYERASIFAFPSLDEGFGLPVLEAMARGVPVITSNRSALAEVAGEAALLVDPERSEDIEHALLRLTNDESLRSDLVTKGQARAAQFSWEKAVDQTRAVYAELVSR